MHIPKVFVSYSWDSENHKAWVKSLSTKLRNDGVGVTLDQWHLVPGDQIPQFMELAVKESDFVIIICTPIYKNKSDARKGGVGYEGDIITAEVLTTKNERKFIPILREGSPADSMPSWLLGKYYIDLSGNPYSSIHYNDLLNTIQGTREKAPPILSKNGSKSDEASDIKYVLGDELPSQVQNGMGIRFNLVKGGQGIIGSDTCAEDDARPAKLIELSTFYLSRYPVSNRDFYQFILDHFDGKTSGLETRYGKNFLAHWKNDVPDQSIMNHPVTYVSWLAAMDFCKWVQEDYLPLSIQPNVSFIVRLPSEAEWEFAANNRGSQRIYPWGDSPPSSDRANFNYQKRGTTPNGSYPANELGLFDLAGNVGEWCVDDYSPVYHKEMPRSNPINNSGTTRKVMRGGSWFAGAELMRVFHRDYDKQNLCDKDVGFRICAIPIMQ